MKTKGKFASTTLFCQGNCLYHIFFFKAAIRGPMTTEAWPVIRTGTGEVVKKNEKFWLKP